MLYVHMTRIKEDILYNQTPSKAATKRFSWSRKRKTSHKKKSGKV